MKALSILIPVYNDDVADQVGLLRSQCMAIDGLSWEIIVSDDGSAEEWIRKNEKITLFDNCKFILRHKDFGRAANRNFLARQAEYDTLIYIDSGLKPNPHFVENYVDNIGKALVVCGNIAVDPTHIDMTSLRCRNELRAQKRFTANKHSIEPYKNFHSGTFMINRQTILGNPFREDILTYGYEDTLFGKQLANRNISILHIDNPVMFVRFESNSRFLEKTKEGISTLYNYREELEGYSPLLHLVSILRKYHLLWLPKAFFKCFGGLILKNLKGKNPSLTLFSLYRVCLLSSYYNLSSTFYIHAGF